MALASLLHRSIPQRRHSFSTILSVMYRSSGERLSTLLYRPPFYERSFIFAYCKPCFPCAITNTTLYLNVFVELPKNGCARARVCVRFRALATIFVCLAGRFTLSTLHPLTPAPPLDRMIARVRNGVSDKEPRLPSSSFFLEIGGNLLQIGDANPNGKVATVK